MSTSRVAIVTGAARGIGAAVAKRLAAEGHAVAVLDLDENACAGTVEAIQASGGKALAVGADVSDETSVQAAFKRIVEELGEPTILVNNAGVTRDNMLHKMNVADWDIVMAVHLRGAFLMSRELRPFIQSNKFGRIVNLSSLAAQGHLGQANYSAAKAGMQGLTKTLAIEIGRLGGTANAIAPGFVQTDMTAATAERLGVPFDEFIAANAKEIPVQRVGQPEDIANAVAFLASEKAGYITGQIIEVSGGMSM